MSRRARALWGLALLVIGACADASTGPVGPTAPPPFAPIELSAPWVEATPAQVGMNAAVVNAAVGAASAIPRFRSLLVVKDGRLVVEEYFGGRTRQSLHDVRSVTKSIVGTLAALAVEEGHISSLDDRIEDYLAPGVATLDIEQGLITVRHLLTMTSGFQWDESGGIGDYGLWIRSDDHIETLLDRPIVNPPGSGFVYNSAAVHLLGVLIEEAVGETLGAFANRALFAPLGIDDVQWEPLTRGYVNGGSGIDLTARDLARFGQLYLQEGVSGTTRLLPESWVGSATSPQFGWRSSYGALDRYTYGYLWWVSESETERAYLAWGYGGQFVYVVPSLNLVVVATTDWKLLSAEGGPASLEQSVLGVLIEGIHRAAR
ncbi:MAG: beta-lactamase family protein [Gemmatimonadota bacterium]|nr:beta-lactamase family protein [Gemmatimonadota bacterium]